MQETFKKYINYLEAERNASPYTIRNYSNDLWGNYKRGSKVNVETDMFARYVSHIIAHQKSSPSLTWGEVDAINTTF